MDKILLVIPDWNLRQVYHELLLSKTAEIVACDSIENAVLHLTLTAFTIVVVWVEEDDAQMDVFLHLRNRRGSWKKTRFVLLASDKVRYQPLLQKADIVLNPLKLPMEDVITRIKGSL